MDAAEGGQGGGRDLGFHSFGEVRGPKEAARLMITALTTLPASQQDAIRLASDVLRRARAAEPLPLTVINRTGQ